MKETIISITIFILEMCGLVAVVVSIRNVYVISVFISINSDFHPSLSLIQIDWGVMSVGAPPHLSSPSLKSVSLD